MQIRFSEGTISLYRTLICRVPGEDDNAGITISNECSLLEKVYAVVDKSDINMA